MANKLETVRDAVSIEKTPRDAGLMIRLEIVDYDNGLININGEPMGGMGGTWPDRSQAVQALNCFISQALQELFTQSRKRKPCTRI